MQKHLSGLINLVKYFFVRFLKLEVIINNYFLGHRKFYCGSRTEFFRTANYGKEEVFLGAFLYSLKDDDVIWDIGSSIGIVSIYAAPYVKKVIAFEPDKAIYKKLCRNVELNGLNNKIDCRNLGISNMEGKVFLNTDGVEGFSPSISNLGRHGNQAEISVNTVDNIILNEKDAPTIIKIDIEGAEILALKGASSLLKSERKPRLLFVEIHPTFLKEFNSSEKEIIDIVLGYDYQIINYTREHDQVHIIASPKK